MARHDTRKSAWLDVYRALRSDIDRGNLEPSDDLPTISSLASISGLSPYGARRVLERLCKEGRAQSWQGKGFRVAMPVIRLSTSEHCPKFGDTITALGYQSSSALLSSKTVGLNEQVARRMRSRPGAKAIMTETIRKVNGRPVALSHDFFVRNRLGGIAKTLATNGSVSRSLEEYGFASYRRDFTELACRFPTEHEALLLGIPRSQPVYATLGANLVSRDDVIQVSCGVWRADCVVYEF